MSTSCPVCEEPVAEAAGRCSTCGFPNALGLEASRALSQPEPAPRAERPRRASPAPPTARPAPDVQAEVARRVAQELQSHLSVYEKLGGDPEEIVNEVTQAALIQADGRTAEALSVLRAADTRVLEMAAELFDRRVRGLEHREEILQKDRLHVEVRSATASMRTRFESGRRDEALGLLNDSDRELSAIEGEWSNLRSLLQQVDALREAARESHQEILDVEDDARRVQGLLDQPTIDRATVAQATELSSRNLMRLHEALPAVLEDELESHAQKLDTMRDDPEAGRRARALHAEASRHLRRGRIADANERLRELRQVIRRMEEAQAKAPAPKAAAAVVPPAAVAPAAAAVSAPAPAPEGPDPALARLLQQARGLAARVRSLPPDSEIAFEAAAEIRRATELLRARKLQEAEQTLTRLMRTLDAESSGEEVVA